jgi:hypothetical protein
VRVVFAGNYGNKEVTCVYQFRVHGDPVPADK